MALIIILICISLQRFLGLASSVHRFDWAQAYLSFVSSKFKGITEGHGLVAVLVLVLPLVIAAGLIFALTYHLLTVVGYWILSAALLWYCLDARDLASNNYDGEEPATLLENAYQHLFAMIFWYGFIGPVGLVLYVAVYELRHFVQQQSPTQEPLLSYLQATQGALDWVPVRLLGLSFALVGHFASTFKLWLADLSAGLANNKELVVRWGMAALQVDEKAPTEKLQAETVNLLDRALLVWLIAMAVFVLGLIFG